MLLAASASDRVRRMAVAAPYTRDVVARYVAGDDAAAAVEATRRLRADGLAVTLDYLGEDTTSADHATAVAAEYVALLGRLAADGLSQGGAAEVSVKPTAEGLNLPEHGEKTAAANIARVCAALRLVAELRGDFPDLGCVIQSQLRRSAADCAALAYAGSRVRLCKGAYDAPEEVAFRARAEVDRSYARCLRVLMAGPGYPMFATHDPRLIKIIAAQAVLTGRGSTGFEYQMLYGIRPA